MYDLNAQYKNQALEHGFVNPKTGEVVGKGVDAVIKADNMLREKAAAKLQ